MRRKIVSVSEPKLRKVSKPVKNIDKRVTKLIKDLKDTLEKQKDPEGVGLAAPQIGKLQRVFIVKYKGKSKTYINPKLIKTFSGKVSKKKVKNIMEGCLSLPHFYGPLRRPKKAKIEYTNEKGEKITETLGGFKAQIIQHEIDHLNGILFVDRLLEQKKPLFELVNGEWQKVEI